MRELLAPTTAATDRLGALLDAAVDAIVLIDREGRITRFNHAAERLFDYASAEVLGHNVKMLMPSPYQDEHDGYMLRYLQTGERRIIGIGREVTARRRDGSRFPIELSVGEFRSGEERGFVGILRDISARKAQEERLYESTREAQLLRDRLAHAGRLGTLGEMVSGIAHEVNQPLTAINNYASACRRMLLSGQAHPAELVEVLEKISRQADRAGQVIRGLRSMVRQGEPEREMQDIDALIEEVSRMVEIDLRGTSERLVLDLARGLPPFIGDGVQMQQVVMNLIRNGIDAMRESARGEEVCVSTRLGADGQLEVVVADQGPGLAAEVENRLFDPFVTTKRQGMGLGLSISKSIVNSHGGELNYRRGAAGGAEFVLRLPVADADADAEQEDQG